MKVDHEGKSVMQRLVEYLPEVAQVCHKTRMHLSCSTHYATLLYYYELLNNTY